ncbi:MULTISPECIES: TROVE domain-containing protein [Bosea]|uniref:TROVE domain-containing protein n=1 Tax=Bosea TaxID=85413 RepID=UPI0038579D41
MRVNVRAASAYGQFQTFEGAPAKRITDEQALRRSVLSCLLWEREFYEDGQTIVERIVDLAGKVAPEKVAALAIEARSQFHLRHVPLLLTSALARHSGGKLVEDAVAGVIQRADELSELAAIHAKVNGVTPDKVKPKLSAAMKRGLARAFLKFNEYALAKYNRDNAVRLRDVLFLCHAKPDSPEREALWKRLAAGELAAPDTWEVALSGGADKRETFERLIREGQLGYLALLRNLRNMVDAGCDMGLVRSAIVARKGADRVLPFRYVAAARAAPRLEPEIDTALCEAVASAPRLSGKTIVLVDVSGSMDAPLSARSDLKRIDAAAALASVVHGDLRVFSFSDRLVEVPPRRGMAGVDAVIRSQPHGSTYLGQAVTMLNREPHDRLIVITDEQSHDRVPDPAAKLAYMINVASAKNGVGYGKWTHIDGFSESVIRYIHESENDRG